MGKLLSLFLKLPRKALEKSLVAERRIFEFGRTVNPIGVEKGIELLKWKRELKQLCWVFAKKSFKLFFVFQSFRQIEGTNIFSVLFDHFGNILDYLLYEYFFFNGFFISKENTKYWSGVFCFLSSWFWHSSIFLAKKKKKRFCCSKNRFVPFQWISLSFSCIEFFFLFVLF